MKEQELCKAAYKEMYGEVGYTTVPQSNLFLQHLLRILKEIDCSKEEISILDVGTGCGKYTHTLFENGYTKVYTMDLFENAPKSFENIEYRTGDIENIPYDSESFDVVFAQSVIYHANSIENAIDELLRVTKSGGCLLFSAHTKYSLATLKYKMLADMGVPSVANLKGVVFHMANEYLTILEKCGMKNIVVDGWFSGRDKLIRVISFFVRRILHKEYVYPIAKITNNKLWAKFKAYFGYHMIISAKKS